MRCSLVCPSQARYDNPPSPSHDKAVDLKSYLYPPLPINRCPRYHPRSSTCALYLLSAIMPKIQTIRSRYIDKARLNELLKRLFGSGNFEVEVRVRVALAYIPRTHAAVYKGGIRRLH